MALVTLQRSPTPSATSSASTSEEFGNDEERKANLSLSDSFFMVKGAAIFLQQGNSFQGQRSLLHLHKNAGDLPQHLQLMINLLRSEDRIKLAVRLESSWSDRVRYMVVVYSNGRQDTEENILLGVDFTNKESKSCTIGMVLHLWSDTTIRLDGDGGFSVNTAGRTHVFKPVSVQAMWSALQMLHKACEVARRYNYFPGGLALVWASYYESCISSEQSCINEWNTMQDLESTRPDSPILFMEKPNEGENTEWVIKTTLRGIMMSQDLENVTCKEIRNELEKKLSCNLKEYKEYIDNEMLLILGQMDKASLIFDYLYLGSEWNASNLEELNNVGVGYILNVTREIDNFFPGLFAYHNIRVYDEESTDLLSHWNDAYNFINKAKKNHSKCLVHCKMGVSRSASTVIAYAMKEYGWSMEKAYNYVKQKRNVARPNAGFMRQLSEYEGILDASNQRHNKLWKQHREQAEFESMFPSAYQPPNMESDLQYKINEEDVDDQVLPESKCFGNLPEPHGLIEPTMMLEVQDLERDALLVDPPFPEPFCTLTTKEKTCMKAGRDLDIRMREVRKKLDFEKTLGPKYLEDDLSSVETSAPMMCYREDHRVSKEFLNNSSSKRSCPKDSEEDAIFGILSKVKPPYPSCTDCIYSETQEECQDLDTAGIPEAPTVCTQPALLQHMTSAVLDRMHGHKLVKPTPLQTDLSTFASTPSKANDVNYSDSINLHETKDEEFCDDSKRNLKQGKDLKYLFFSRDLEKPATHSYLMQHQESIMQLQKAGLVRKHTKELERLKSEGSSVLKESPIEKTESCKLDHTQQPSDQSIEEQTGSTEKVELVDILDGVFQKTSTPSYCKADLISSYTKDFLKTICYTPASSSMSSNLTRSSSSDSIHSIRGKPGLVKQRTQEIETRMRLAGLTLSSPLKRSHSLAKLGSLNFSTDDLSGDPDTFQISEFKSPRLRDNFICTDTPSSTSTMENPSGLTGSNNSSMTETEPR
ncbi:protein phosphatase Slingshot homolog 1 isoform X1 [Bufo bufo]|uniref:protein phosphatase Slingshot homolog 1 isoform X1 n=3 Tax=Bufo bufo TaxID=8384 RepID=UPI001ABEB55E|nr:protein phosphatase Slingshot homolog 1 isoform X1 [Bufo bufo]